MSIFLPHPWAALPLVLGLGWSLGVARSCGKPVVGTGVGSSRATQRSRDSVRTPIAQFHTRERAGSGVSLTFGPFEHTCSCLSFPISCRPLPPCILTLAPSLWPSSQGQAGTIPHPGPFSLCLTQGLSPFAWGTVWEWAVPARSPQLSWAPWSSLEGQLHWARMFLTWFSASLHAWADNR